MNFVFFVHELIFFILDFWVEVFVVFLAVDVDLVVFFAVAFFVLVGLTVYILQIVVKIGFGCP